MKMYEVSLKSKSPILMHSSAAIGLKDNSKKKGGEAIQGNPDEWKESIYFDKDLGVYIPACCFEASFIEASKQFKISGKATATKFFKSGLFVNTDNIPIYVNGHIIKTLEEVEKMGSVDKRTVKNPATKMRNMRYRACFMNWECKFKIILQSDDYISDKILKDVIEYAGNFVGVCDYRPRFGRFDLISIKCL